MRVICALLIFATMLPGFATQASQFTQRTPASKPPFSISIRAVQDTVKVGTKAKIVVTLTNTTDGEIFVRREKRPDEAELGYKIDVRDETGNTAPKTGYQHALQGEDTGGKPMIVVSAPMLSSLKPDGSFSESTELNKLFDLKRPGKYAVQVERIDETTKQTVKSNTIILTVVP